VATGDGDPISDRGDRLGSINKVDPERDGRRDARSARHV
jgi:hypothetical protein